LDQTLIVIVGFDDFLRLFFFFFWVCILVTHKKDYVVSLVVGVGWAVGSL
jgi:hypothetical protein